MIGFITNNVNVLLLAFLVFLLAGGFIYFNYQDSRYVQLYDQKQEIQTQLTATQQNLTANQQRLQETFNELQSKLQDSVKFETLYNNISGQRNQLQSDLASLQNNYNSEVQRRKAAETARDTYSKELQAAQTNITVSTALISAKDALISQLQSQVATCAMP